MPPAKPVKLLLSSCIPCGRTRSSTTPTRRLSLRRQILSTAGLPEPTTPLKTERKWNGTFRVSDSPFSSPKSPQRKTPIFLLPSPRNLKKHALFLILFYFHGSQNTDKENIILFVFQKTFCSLATRIWQQALHISPSTNSVFLIRGIVVPALLEPKCEFEWKGH